MIHVSQANHLISVFLLLWLQNSLSELSSDFILRLLKSALRIVFVELGLFGKVGLAFGSNLIGKLIGLLSIVARGFLSSLVIFPRSTHRLPGETLLGKK